MQISKQYTQYGAALLFFIFGFKMLYEVATTVEKVLTSFTHPFFVNITYLVDSMQHPQLQ